jgi:hypothetical protein
MVSPVASHCLAHEIEMKGGAFEGASMQAFPLIKASHPLRVGAIATKVAALKEACWGATSLG